MSIVANWLGSMAYWNQLRGKSQKALKRYSKAYGRGMRDQRALCAYCLLLVQEGQPQKAVEVIERALEDRGKYKPKVRARIYVNAAIAYWKNGDLDTAIKWMKKAFKLTPTSSVYGSLGYFLIEQGERTGDYAEALEFNIKALDYDEEDPVIQDNMGQLYFRMGEFEKAIEHLRKALAKRELADSMYYLIGSLLECGEKQEAQGWAEKLEKATFKATSTVTREQALALVGRVRRA